MSRIDKAIMETSNIICKNITKFNDESERGILSQNILAHLRNFVEYIIQKIHSNGADIDPNNYEKKKEALSYVKTKGKLNFLSRFHYLLQRSASHYTIDEDGSERLMLKYYEYLLRIKILLKDSYNLDILENIDEFPLNLDTSLKEYYDKIADKIDTMHPDPPRSTYSDRYYIQKIKPFFVDQKVYYEVTFSVANDKASKFDRVIAFTNLEITGNYAVTLSVRNDCIDIVGKTMPIQIIDYWSVSIRPCELNNFIRIFGNYTGINSGSIEYRNLNRFLTDTRLNLVDLVRSSDAYYSQAKGHITHNAKAIHFFKILDKCRVIIRRNAPGCNVLSYLLYKMNNRIEKRQYSFDNCDKLSRLHLKYGCIPFDEMPFATSLVDHNPKLYDLFECISAFKREHELFARKIKNNTEKRSQLFTHRNDIIGFQDIDALIKKYNSKLYYKHTGRFLREYKDHIYISSYANDSAEIIKVLRSLSESGIGGYTKSFVSWLHHSSYSIDCEEKKEKIKYMFEQSRVALIYGSAGTGKSTIINHISNFFNDINKIYLANTNPAVDNIRRRVNADNRDIKTIAKFLHPRNHVTECDLLVIDECSTVSNDDMRKILEKAKFKLLVLVGDVMQIESILFGNWFSIAQSFVPKQSLANLVKPYRTESEELLTVWDRVRKLDIAILEPMVKSRFSTTLDESIFEHSDRDEIVLCLNYDGLYGINNINRFLQNNNPNKPYTWGINNYKVGDPILFNESERFAPLIYNNMKGTITDIDIIGDKIRFNVELDIAINELYADYYDFTLVENTESENSVISFTVNKHRSTDEDDDSSESIVPFQVAYAVSIHKAQGLEYKSVKIVITNEVEELITHDIFYTAITRAIEKLKIYWSPETENKILKNLKLKDSRKDAHLLASLYGL